VPRLYVCAVQLVLNMENDDEDQDEDNSVDFEGDFEQYSDLEDGGELSDNGSTSRVLPFH